jgi:hypothetical protein
VRHHATVTGAATVLLVAACGSSSSATTVSATPVEATSSSAAPSTHSAGRPDAAHLAAGVAAVKKAFPALTTGRTDKSIGNDIDNTCFDMANGEDQAVILRHVAGRFEHDGTTPNQTQAAAIMKLIQTTACPS